MNQYAFRIEKNGRRDTVHCTASRPSYAWLAVLNAYGAEFAVSAAPVAVLAPHEIAAEIDASDMTDADARYLMPRVRPYLERMLTAEIPF